MNTFDELERAAYMAGNTALAASFAAMEDLERMESVLETGGIDVMSMLSVDDVSPQIDDIQSKAIADNCPDYEEYKQFFFDCFARLDGHYPCPDVTSDYDKNIIFEAISKGE